MYGITENSLTLHRLNFSHIFVKNKSDDFKKALIAPVHGKAGLGSPPQDAAVSC